MSRQGSKTLWNRSPKAPEVLPVSSPSQGQPSRKESKPTYKALVKYAFLALATFGIGYRSLPFFDPESAPSHAPTGVASRNLVAVTYPKEQDLFVRRRGDKLYLGDDEFRFISFNVPNLHVIEDGAWHSVHSWEQEDGIKTVARMGGRVARIYSFSVKGGLHNSTNSHIMGPELYNEELFKALDHLLFLARKYDVRLCIPMLDNWSWWGGHAEFAALYGKNREEFYTDSTVRDGFKNFLRFLLERRNAETGVLYKDDPFVFAWETGNELDFEDPARNYSLPTGPQMDEWTSDIAKFIKTVDKEHLVVDGRLVDNREISASALADPNTDILSDHFYPNMRATFMERLDRMRSMTVGKKAFMVGEFGLMSARELRPFLDHVVSSDVPGALIWSLRSHSHSGGFYHHHEYGNFWAYHYPGFESSEKEGEIYIFTMMKDAAYQASRIPVPPTEEVDAPELIETSSIEAISWRGSVGAHSYILERKEDIPESRWKVINAELLDNMNPYTPYKDTTAMPGTTYWYRISAANDVGFSKPSKELLLGSGPEAIKMSFSDTQVSMKASSRDSLNQAFSP